MPAISLKYGRSSITVNVPERNFNGIVKLKGTPKEIDVEKKVRQLLEKPIGSASLESLVDATDKVVIVLNDVTRPVPNTLLLPSLIETLINSGVDKENIAFVFGLGSHRAHTIREKRNLVGDKLYKEFRFMDHDVERCEYVGTTDLGTDIEIFKPVVHADLRICIGIMGYHYFVGYSGGLKSIFPGVASVKSIERNHSMMLDEGAIAGKLETNPVRMEIDSVQKYLTTHFILNVILDQRKIIDVFAGNPIEAHRRGAEELDNLYKVEVEEASDVVVVSPSGYPKDINLYQAQKALDAAERVLKPGGQIILVADCPDGYGNRVFEEWLQAKTIDKPISMIKDKFVLGGHKAAAIASTRMKHKIFLKSSLRNVPEIYLEKIASVNSTIEGILKENGDAKISFIPDSNIHPQLKA